MQLRGFTISELLVTLALTSVVITMSYTSFNYVQKLLQDYRRQSDFVTQVADLSSRLENEALKCRLIIQDNENRFIFRHDSGESSVEIRNKYLLFSKSGHCDTFRLNPFNLQIGYEPLQNPGWANRLLNHLQFETKLAKQNFVLGCRKEYSAALKLALEQPH